MPPNCILHRRPPQCVVAHPHLHPAADSCIHTATTITQHRLQFKYPNLRHHYSTYPTPSVDKYVQKRESQSIDNRHRQHAIMMLMHIHSASQSFDCRSTTIHSNTAATTSLHRLCAFFNTQLTRCNLYKYYRRIQLAVSIRDSIISNNNRRHFALVDSNDKEIIQTA
jgi:pyruvate dehydrogenase complex dehydrogenase (E1) component